MTRARLFPLFVVSGVTVGMETALTRYFAVAGWSEYGYWVISIVLAGFALAGVAVALLPDWFRRHGDAVLAWLPPLLVITAAVGYRLTTTNPFNPLALQNPATLGAELWHIAGYDAALLPFFLASGLFVSLSFIARPAEPGRVYAFDLAGAGLGSALVLGLMFVLPPFRLVPMLLPVLAASARRRGAIAATLLALGGAEATLLLDDRAAVNDYKPIYAPLHTPGARIVAERLSPRGQYQVLDDFTERVDTDVSNDAAMLGLPGPPRALGLYRDGNRLAALAGPAGLDVAYAGAALDSLPYALEPRARALVIGASGGFRAAAPLALGAVHVDVVEPDPVMRAALREGLGPAPPLPRDDRRALLDAGPFAAARAGAEFGVIDVSADFLDANEANASAFSAEAVAAYLHAITPDGIVSLPASIRDFPVYALRLLATVREAIGPADDPATHVLVYRSAWNARVLISPAVWTPERITAARAWCAERSFDVSYFPGMDPDASRDAIFNDLPAVSFARGAVTSTGLDDAVADEARTVLDGRRSPSAEEFDVRPITLDRPFFQAALDLTRIGTVIRRLEILPQGEVGAVVNVAVLAQACVLALCVLALPLLARGRLAREAHEGEGVIGRAAVFFPALGLGFLFVEIFAIDRASLFLGDRASGFALVLTGMLIFSGLGSLLASRTARPGAALTAALAVVLAWCGLAGTILMPALLAGIGLPWAARAALCVLAVAPVSVALGTFFPLGLARLGRGGVLPWAWALNGAFSVVATPAANLLARQSGYGRVLIAAVLLYGVAYAAFPAARRARSWQVRSRAAE